MVSENPLLLPETAAFCNDEVTPSFKGVKGNKGFSSSFEELNKQSSGSGSVPLSGDWDPGSPSLSSVAFRLRLSLLSSDKLKLVAVELSTDEQSDSPK